MLDVMRAVDGIVAARRNEPLQLARIAKHIGLHAFVDVE